MRKGDEGKKGWRRRSKRQRTESTFSPPPVMYYVPRTDGERERWDGIGCVFAQTDMFKHFCLSLVRQTQSSSPLPLERSMSAHFLHLSTKMDEKKEGNRERERETTLMNEGEFLPRFVVEEGKRRGRDGNRQRRVSLARKLAALTFVRNQDRIDFCQLGESHT